MKITIAAIGALKEDYWKDALKEYRKRISRYGELELLEFPDEKTPAKESEAEEEKIRNKEGKALLKLLNDRDAYVIALVIKGERMDSLTFSRKIASLFSEGINRIIFLIGGSLGLSEEVISRSDLRLSFSDFTFPHQMMRVILAEQLYRAMRIMHHEPYHK